ncbi:nitrite/sulfite reductase [methanotrophic endosymbiont of Bathymodiolus puteoserpentis (Logatchev)]|jgi:sulfite reductase (NADPH) hemoprotein beta-component|uniref:nitrite/sulfite reductase n=1 Tax=methanotrophic endosymbiont of Bathymodiolus puteoserpentis (Logatchev) TaxID=343235 RepID=UPI0013CD0AE8|nr:nitrite/sulfite reductase [methanotrophic endosymbiont of Bathymodiolus puteoserpentis (Logatchev)]SHE20264.1 Sulfite reductase [NADPH] hemoprotein beta-component [methanotrophic endosymbiont of Bathymodiolus puteoserpentis (Logatchev)]
MYQYTDKDQTIIDERVTQFRDQTERFLKGEIPEDKYRALRLMNGVYIQTHAPLLRVAGPYGLLSSQQVRKLASIARDYDKGYCHFTTRQNIQFNWPELERVPDILEELASVQMHAIQTSGNCLRNTTSDQLAGVCKDEIEDPRPYCEIIRQWTILHPEFAYLPRKFKIAVSGAKLDRAATQFHDIGLHLVENEQGIVGFKVFVGGGLGRTPVVGQMIKPFLEKEHLLSYLEAIVRVYNLKGRRDNKYKARIKILVRETGLAEFSKQVDAEWALIKDKLAIPAERIMAMQAQFALPAYQAEAAQDTSYTEHLANDERFATWIKHNTAEHKIDGYRAVYISLKAPDNPPGDCSDVQLDAIAALADEYSFGMVRTTHRQNLVLADIKQADLFVLWQKLVSLKLATPNIGKATDMICCPGLDYCSLALAGSIGVAQEINDSLDSIDYVHDLGEIKINISGCMNGCAHQSVGHIGILGLDKKGEEWYQVTLGGSSENDAAIGDRLGPAVRKEEITPVVVKLLEVYLEQRLNEDEAFLATYRRVGMNPFKERVYATH